LEDHLWEFHKNIKEWYHNENKRGHSDKYETYQNGPYRTEYVHINGTHCESRIRDRLAFLLENEDGKK